ncbi:hypothetical protein NPIL_120611 [Nephila pilipes]|uniref:Uncharacterized protein n=1 Tax=Nephila pilipes TaxID=299642 RepID=A0A8X6MP56_NEPPI|nr:hypothetical protein NPIL_120611 [Nephila pilipes]
MPTSMATILLSRATNTFYGSHERLCIGRLHPAFGSSHSASSVTKSGPLGTLIHRPTFKSRKDSTTIEKPLRTSNRVSPVFVLSRHSSPSFVSQRVSSGFASSPNTVAGHRCAPLLYAGDPDNNKVLCTRGLLRDPVTRTHVRLLGPCFKMGRVGHRPTALQHRRPPNKSQSGAGEASHRTRSESVRTATQEPTCTTKNTN